MWRDKIVEDVRKTREKILKDADFDMKKILNEIKEMQENDKDKLVAVPENKELAIL